MPKIDQVKTTSTEQQLGTGAMQAPLRKNSESQIIPSKEAFEKLSKPESNVSSKSEPELARDADRIATGVPNTSKMQKFANFFINVKLLCQGEPTLAWKIWDNNEDQKINDKQQINQSGMELAQNFSNRSKINGIFANPVMTQKLEATCNKTNSGENFTFMKQFNQAMGIPLPGREATPPKLDQLLELYESAVPVNSTLYVNVSDRNRVAAVAAAENYKANPNPETASVFMDKMVKCAKDINERLEDTVSQVMMRYDKDFGAFYLAMIRSEREKL
jgi:hypothetical protein